MKRLSLPVIFWISLFASASVYAQELEEAKQQYYFGIGRGWFDNMNSGSANVITPGVMWSVDPTFDLGIMTDITFSLHDSDVRIITPQLKGRYFFQEEDTVGYYVGAGFGYGYSHSHKEQMRPSDSASGIASSLAIGFKAYRTSTVQISGELEYSWIWESTDYGTPQMILIKAGLHFY